jgi:UDP-glucose 4-epimerase
VYGERQNIGDRYRNVVGIFMNQLMQGQPMTIFGDGQQSRAFSYIQDVAPIIADSPFNHQALNKVFNIGAETPHTVNDLAKVVSKAMGCKEDISYLDARNEVLHAFSSHKKLQEIFGETANVSLEDGVHRMATWAKKVGAKRGKTFEGVEIMKNMPKSWESELAQVSS